MENRLKIKRPVSKEDRIAIVKNIANNIPFEPDYQKVSEWLTKLATKVIAKKFYIVNFSDPMRPIVIGLNFETREQAFNYITGPLRSKGVFIVYRGRELITFNQVLKDNKWSLRKYEYPINCKSDQQKKSFRTKRRRQIRLHIAEQLGLASWAGIHPLIEYPEWIKEIAVKGNPKIFKRKLRNKRLKFLRMLS